eukprot:4296252-Pleurochrysis_carterae.AAC.6
MLRITSDINRGKVMRMDMLEPAWQTFAAADMWASECNSLELPRGKHMAHEVQVHFKMNRLYRKLLMATTAQSPHPEDTALSEIIKLDLNDSRTQMCSFT